MFIDKRIVNHGEALYILSLSHISKSIVDGVEAAGTDVLGGEVYVAPFICGSVLAEQYDAVGTVATVYFDIHKLIYQFKIINKHIRIACPSALTGDEVNGGCVGAFYRRKQMPGSVA